MLRLVALKHIYVSGKLLSPGDHFKTNQDVKNLMDKGYLRALTHQENEAILDEYVAYAEEVFDKPVSSRKEKRPLPEKKIPQYEQGRLL
jgi:hypothetical protein